MTVTALSRREGQRPCDGGWEGDVTGSNHHGVAEKKSLAGRGSKETKLGMQCGCKFEVVEEEGEDRERV